MMWNNPLYEELRSNYQTLNFKEKKVHLIQILKLLDEKSEFYQGLTTRIQVGEIDEAQLDSLYEIIMKTLAEDFESRKTQKSQIVQQKFQELMKKYQESENKDREEAEKLFDDLDE